MSDQTNIRIGVHQQVFFIKFFFILTLYLIFLDMIDNVLCVMNLISILGT